MSVGTSALAPAAARARRPPPDPPRLGVRVPRRTPIPIRRRVVRRGAFARDAPTRRGSPPRARAPLLGPRRGRLAAAFARTRRLVPGRESAVSAVDPERAGAGAESAVVVADPDPAAPDPAASTAPLDVLPPPAVERDSRTGATPDGGLAFDPARAAAAPRAPPR